MHAGVVFRALTNMRVVAKEVSWLERFHAGERSLIEACYREHVGRVLASASRVLGSVDAETVTHEVFYRLLSDVDLRASYRGGNLGAWLSQVASHAAIDNLRRRKREIGPVDEHHDASSVDDSRFDEEVEAKLLIERFCREVLPAKWHAVFKTRFLRQLPQREAAHELGMQRTTLVYQEKRIRELLEQFLLGTETP
jgi:RNA polymerase sigma-70 factor, ECF subfamily